MPKAALGVPAPIHIFKAGRHTAMQGRTLEFSAADLAATAAAYDPALHEAPLVIGHPADNAPAFGWVAGLSADAGGLYATPRQLEPAFAEEVRAGRYKKVSASFYVPDSPHNPHPGVFYLRHVGFLGAQPPAVKGLAPVQFAEGDDEAGCVTVEFAESPGLLRRLADVFRGLREYIVEKDGAETADRVLPAWAVSELQENAAQAAAAVGELASRTDGDSSAAAGAAEIPAFAESSNPKETPMPETPATTAATPAAPEMAVAFAEARKKADELAAQVAELRADARLTSARALVEQQVAAGRLTPAQTQGLAEFMASLDDELTFEFAEADGKAAAVTPLAFMTAFLQRLPKQVEFAEVSRDTHDQVDGLTPGQAAQAALDYQEEARRAGRTVSITDALDAVRAGRKEGK